MAHIQIGFLGKARKEEGQYKMATYVFDGDTQESSRFFGLALNKRINPDRLIFLGTSGSMWDVLCEYLKTDSEDQWIELSNAVEADCVTQQQLDEFTVPVSAALQKDSQLIRIPYGDDLQQQVEILKIMASTIRPDDTVSLDLTHGLRHLPMLGLLSAMYLQTAQNVTIKNIYYGALDRTKNGLTPVMQLKGLLHIADWLNALDGFNKTGNLAPFSGLLEQDGMNAETANYLQEAAFFESTLNIPDARKPLKKFAEATQNGLSGIAALFEKSLLDRISWYKEDKLYKRQRSNAYFYLKQGDYLRAAALGFEAYITRFMLQEQTVPKLDPQNYEHRDKAKKSLKSNSEADFKSLSHLRNALAHGTRSNIKEIQYSLHSKNNLDAELNRLFNTLLPKES